MSISTDTHVPGADEATYAKHRDVLDRMIQSLGLRRGLKSHWRVAWELLQRET